MSDTFSIRGLSPEIKALLRQRAKSNGMTIAQFLEHLLKTEAQGAPRVNVYDSIEERFRKLETRVSVIEFYVSSDRHMTKGNDSKEIDDRNAGS